MHQLTRRKYPPSARVAQLVRALDFYVGLFLFCSFLVPPDQRRVTRVPQGARGHQLDRNTTNIREKTTT